MTYRDRLTFLVWKLVSLGKETSIFISLQTVWSMGLLVR
jgi:hypothetical protein